MAVSSPFDPWSPPRPYPVHRWLARRFAFRVPHPRSFACPLDAQQRRDLELRLLVSHLPARLHALVLPNLRLELLRRFPWSLERCAAGPPLMAAKRFPAAALEDSRVLWLRAMLVSEWEIGLTTIQTPLAWLSRPARNHALALRAARLGQLVETLERCPEAEPLAQDIEHALAALRF